MTKRSDVHQADFYLLVDGVRYSYHDINAGNDGSHHPTGSFIITIQLKAEQLVQVENDNSAGVFGTHKTGYLHFFFARHMLFGL